MTPPPFRRLFAYSVDAVAGGSNYDALTSGAIPDANVFLPVSGGTFSWGRSDIDRSDEVRGIRPKVAPIPFRAMPTMTVPMPLYVSSVKKFLKCALGSEGAVTGTTPGPYTHPLSGVGMGQSVLPAIMPQLVRDTVNQKMSGAYVERISLNFPLDGDGTCELELRGLFAKQEAAATAIPTATFTGLSTDPLMLRDAVATFDGGSAALDISGFSFAWVNNTVQQHYAGHNIASNSIGSPAVLRKLWFPYEHRINAAQDVTYGLTFANTEDLQELALEWGQLQKIVVTVTGPLVAGQTFSETIRFTIYQGEHTGGEVDALAARGALGSNYTGEAFYSNADGADVLVEVIDGQSTAL